MRWRTGRGRNRPGTLRASTAADLAHLTDFVATRSGVEAYLEPRTSVTDTTLLLVAGSGEWTRRRIAGPDAAAAFGRKHAIGVYDGAVVGYPQRVRDWTASQQAAGRGR